MITSFRHDNERKAKRQKILGALFFLALIIFLARGPVSSSLGGVLAVLGHPIWALSEGVGNKTGNLSTLLTSKLALEEENAKLTEEIERVRVEAYSRDRLRAENDELKAKLGRNPEISLLLARVLASPPVSPYDTLIIDAGEEHGVTSGMDVYTDGDFIVGKVSRTWKRSAVVMLFSSPDTELSVTIGSSTIPAIARGAGGGSLRVVLPRGSGAAVGDLVDIPALGAGFAGVVGAIDQPAGSSLETIFLNLPLNIHEVRWVYLAAASDDGRVAQ